MYLTSYSGDSGVCVCVCDFIALVEPIPGDVTSLPLIPMVNSNETLPVLGCREPPLKWCSHVGRILLPQVMASLVCLSFSYSMSSVTCFATFSRILGPFPQVRAMTLSLTFLPHVMQTT